MDSGSSCRQSAPKVSNECIVSASKTPARQQVFLHAVPYSSGPSGLSPTIQWTVRCPHRVGRAGVGSPPGTPCRARHSGRSTGRPRPPGCPVHTPARPYPSCCQPGSRFPAGAIQRDNRTSATASPHVRPLTDGTECHALYCNHCILPRTSRLMIRSLRCSSGQLVGMLSITSLATSQPPASSWTRRWPPPGKASLHHPIAQRTRGLASGWAHLANGTDSYTSCRTGEPLCKRGNSPANTDRQCYSRTRGSHTIVYYGSFTHQ
jgi:hypothetical protein